MIQPIRAPVAPRVVSQTSGEILPLTDEIERFLDGNQTTTVSLRGEGKRTALAHLAAWFPDQVTDGTLALDPWENSPTHQAPRVTVLSQTMSDTSVVLRLVPWGRDDLIEYLLAVHLQTCSSVMRRLEHAKSNFASGSPTVWKLILDRMSEDESLTDAREAVLDELECLIGDQRLSNQIADQVIVPCSPEETGPFGHPGIKSRDTLNHSLAKVDSIVAKLLSIEDVRNEFALRRFVERLSQSGQREFARMLGHRIPVSQLWRIAGAISQVDGIRAKLQKLFKKNHPFTTANCASLLTICDSNWKPRGKRLILDGGHFPDVDWSGVDLAQSDLRGACFSDADLSHADLRASQITRTDFSGADLTATCLSSETSNRFLEDPHAKTTQFRTSFAGANLAGATLSGRHFRCADFSNANLQKINARACLFEQCRFDSTNLAEANFWSSAFDHIDLSGLIFHHCDFQDVNMRRALFERSQIDSTNFLRAQLERSDWTDSVLTKCKFVEANLANSRLANIRWENCNLRDCDLRGATFHMGSTRCGIVDSPYPSHGTRTGFYTDELEEQYFQDPETIRKASLMGCNLCGANISNVDFYLVDLRGAIFDDAQKKQLVSTGAILDDC